MPSILLIARHYYPSPGAATSRLGALVGLLRERGWRVVVITRTTGALVDSVGELGPHGETIRRVAGDSTTGVGIRRSFELVSFPARAYFLASRLDQHFDVVLADPPPTVGITLMRLGHKFKVPTVYYFADSWRELLSASPSKVARTLAHPVGFIERLVLRRSALVVAVTQGRAALARHAGGSTLLAPNGVDGSVFHPRAQREEPFVPPTTYPYFLYAGNFGEAHGATIFAEAVPQLSHKDLTVVYMGYGSAEPQIRELAERWPDQIVVIPPQEPAVAASAYRQAVAGLASVRVDNHLRHAVSVKALASVMTGAPLIYVGEGDFADEVTDNNYGFAVSSDPNTVATKLREMLNNPWSQAERENLSTRVSSMYDNSIQARMVADEISQLLEPR